MIPRFATAVVDELSLTVAVNGNVAATLGVPEIWPLTLSDNPLGRAPPVTDHV